MQTHAFLFSLSVTAIIILIFVGMHSFRTPELQTIATPVPSKKPTHIITSQDIRSIAGEDMLATQLDLARAYIEMGKKVLARNILNHVMKQGNENHQSVAQRLLNQIN